MVLCGMGKNTHKSQYCDKRKQNHCMQVNEPALYILQRESPVLANQMKDYLSIRFDILFILHMSDIERWTNAKVCSYADDTTIFLSGNDKHTVKVNR